MIHFLVEKKRKTPTLIRHHRAIIIAADASSGVECRQRDKIAFLCCCEEIVKTPKEAAILNLILEKCLI
jgi:hypothetical protein